MYITTHFFFSFLGNHDHHFYHYFCDDDEPLNNVFNVVRVMKREIEGRCVKVVDKIRVRTKEQTTSSSDDDDAISEITILFSLQSSSLNLPFFLFFQHPNWAMRPSPFTLLVSPTIIKIDVITFIQHNHTSSFEFLH